MRKCLKDQYLDKFSDFLFPARLRHSGGLIGYFTLKTFIIFITFIF